MLYWSDVLVLGGFALVMILGAIALIALFKGQKQ